MSGTRCKVDGTQNTFTKACGYGEGRVRATVGAAGCKRGLRQ